MRSVASGNQDFSGARQFWFGDKQIQVAELAKLDRSIRYRGEHRTFECNRPDADMVERAHLADQLPGHMPVSQHVELILRPKFRFRLWLKIYGAFASQVATEQRQHAVMHC